VLKLPNGHEFSIACASGALAFGRGYWWERHFLVPLGAIDPTLYTVITKTVTAKPRKGNMRWWPPCVLPLWDGGAVNAVGLTNRGFMWLSDEHRAGRFPVRGLKTIVSIMCETDLDAHWMANDIGAWDDPDIVGIELNPSCPNIPHQPMTKEEKIAHICGLFRVAKRHARNVPVGIKLGYLDPYREICDCLDGEADWFDLINTLRWSFLFPRKRSPLAIFGYEGGYSGPKLINYAREALTMVGVYKPDNTLRGSPLKTPIISGGGIGYTKRGDHRYAHEAIWRLKHGASAVTVGTPFLTRFWRVNDIAKRVIEWDKERQSGN